MESLSAVGIVDALISHARKVGASDIHIDPGEEKVLVRVRIDGSLCEFVTYTTLVHHEVIARIKVLAGLKLDEHYVPQDGRIRIEKLCDVRVVVTPSYFGEAAVLRILRPYNEHTTLETLGFSTTDVEKIKTVLKKPSGLILIAGSTGSGKTTSLYTLLKNLLAPDKSVVTIEDPIEYILPGARQVAIRGERMGFAHVLRSVLRQDPNVIMVGEIRDQETAKVALSAALTGHFVLSTIHTKSAEATLTRLGDMGIERYLIDATVSLIIAQKLVPTLCPSCAGEELPTEAEKQFVQEYGGDGIGTIVSSKGCKACGYKGYAGRTALYELLFEGEEQPERTLIEDGIEKARMGVVALTHVMSLT